MLCGKVVQSSMKFKEKEKQNKKPSVKNRVDLLPDDSAEPLFSQVCVMVTLTFFLPFGHIAQVST